MYGKRNNIFPTLDLKCLRTYDIFYWTKDVL